jgi:hypothetical protein
MRGHSYDIGTRLLWLVVTIALLLVAGTVVLAVVLPKHRQDVWGIGTVVVTILLATITAAYVLIMRELLESERRRDLLSFSPFIGIKVDLLELEPKYIQLRVLLNNGGNAPAIDVVADAEIELKYSRLQGEQVVPSHFRPRHVPFLTNGAEEESVEFCFGGEAVKSLIQDVARCQDHKAHEPDMTDMPDGIWQRVERVILRPRIKVFVYCRNHLGQYFRSVYVAPVTIDDVSVKGVKLVSDDELADPCRLLAGHSICIWNNPPLLDEEYNSEPVEKCDIDSELQVRDSNRDIGGFCMPCLDMMPIMRERVNP